MIVLYEVLLFSILLSVTLKGSNLRPGVIIVLDADVTSMRKTSECTSVLRIDVNVSVPVEKN